MNTITQDKMIVLHPQGYVDPRSGLDDGALVLASRNAYPVVARNKGRSDNFGLAAGGAIALMLGGLTFWSMSGSRAPVRVGPSAPPSPATTAMPAPLAPIAPPVAMAQANGASLPIAPPAALGMQVPLANPALDGNRAPAVVFDMSARAPDVLSVPAPAAASAASKTAANLGENEQFASRVGGDAVETSTATAMADPGNTIAQGTLIPAVLETAIDTDLPGYVRAVVSRDVRSFDGTRVLVPRSSRLIGQYKSGLSAGQTRAYVVWSRLIRPDGASVALGSPAVDFAGRAGLDGKVDSHFLKRFGSSMLLSVVGGLGALGSSGTSLVLSSGGQSAASVAAQRDTQIPPTVRVRQGEPIRIFTARDLDFSTLAQ